MQTLSHLLVTDSPPCPLLSDTRHFSFRLHKQTHVDYLRKIKPALELGATYSFSIIRLA